MHIDEFTHWARSRPTTLHKSASTANGCRVRTTFRDNMNRYEVDFAEGFAESDWMQFDTDQGASYFGVWVNPKSFEIMTYAEGDWIFTECFDKERYNAEIDRLCEFHGVGKIGTLMRPEDAHVTVLRQDRNQFYAK